MSANIRISCAGLILVMTAVIARGQEWPARVVETLQREFSESVPRPALHNDPRATDCRGLRHLTSVTYLRVSDVRSELLILQFDPDGTVKRHARRRALTPSGRFRVLTFLMRYPETLGTDGERMWKAAQDGINNEHKVFAASKGYAAPIVTFENTNLLVNPSEIDPHNFEALQGYAERQSIKAHEFDIFMTIDLNPSASAGGNARTELRSVYVGNYARWKSPLDERAWGYVASTAYHHEVGHLWGWEHGWTPSCEQPPERPSYKPFITDPALFGWVDLDGDNIPEINDPTPYGRR